ncbi:MAG: NUDIX hydrolase [Chloroflexi bacterium]|nr:NUDIX hydrolase [Chloroflexota bacterium]
MSGTAGDRGPTGIAQAIELYGRPEERDAIIQVSQETLDYWRNLEDGRTAEVVMLVRRQNGRYLLHTKSFYPEGAYRLLTGGIHAGEDLVRAAMREGREETSLELRLERFVGIVRQSLTHDGEQFCFTSYLFELADQGGSLRAEDEGEGISGYREVSAASLPEVARQLECLDGDWADWGALRAVSHRLAAEALAGRTAG